MSDSELDADAQPFVPTGLTKAELESTLAAIVKTAGARTEDAILAEVDRRDEERDRRDREKEADMTALIRALIESTDRATESAERADREKAEREEDYQRQQWRRWKQEQAERKRREAIKSIPPPPSMGKEQDLADYLDLFKSNMDSRDIPKEARAKHLLPLLNSKATAAIVGLPADSKDDIDILTSTLLATVLETTKYASKAYWNMQKAAGESARATMVKILRMGKRFALGETPEQTLELISIEKFLQLFPGQPLHQLGACLSR